MSTLTFRSVAILIVLSLLLLEGCVTKGSDEKGERFFKEKTWEHFKRETVGRIKRGQGTLTIKEVRALLPQPNMEGETNMSMALGWYFSDADSSSWDIAIASRSSGVEYGYLLVVGFTGEGVVNYFDVQNIVMPSKSWAITSRALVGEFIALKNMQILSDMIGKALDRSADRAIEKADQKFSETINREKAKFADKIDASTANGTISPPSGGSSTITITVSPSISTGAPTAQ